MRKISIFFKKGIDKSEVLWYYIKTDGTEANKASESEKDGSLAQLGEHLPYKQRVIGSSPIVSTILLGTKVPSIL